MNQQQQEMLSALFDGQTSDFETQHLLRELDDEGLARLARYQLISDGMQNRLTDLHGRLDIVGQVAAATEQMPAPHRQAAGWLKPVLGFAAAASLAFVTVVGVQGMGWSPTGPDAFVADGDVSASQLPVRQEQAGLSPVSASSTWVEQNVSAGQPQLAGDRERLRRYIQMHGEQQAAFDGDAGVLPVYRTRYAGEQQ